MSRTTRPHRRHGRPPTPIRPHSAGHGAVATFTPSSVYRPCRPTATPLYRVVQHHLNTFLARPRKARFIPFPTGPRGSFGNISPAASSPSASPGSAAGTVARNASSPSVARGGAYAPRAPTVAWPRSRPTFAIGSSRRCPSPVGAVRTQAPAPPPGGRRRPGGRRSAHPAAGHRWCAPGVRPADAQAPPRPGRARLTDDREPALWRLAGGPGHLRGRARSRTDRVARRRCRHRFKV